MNNKEKIKNINQEHLDRLKYINDTYGPKALNEELDKTKTGDYTLSDIGYVMGITRERVRQIERMALKKLIHPKFSRGIRDYMNMKTSDAKTFF